MKKSMCLILSLILFLSIVPFDADAVEEKIIRLADGSYFTIEIEEYDVRSSGAKTASKTYTYNSASGVSQWKVVLTGTFTYTGSNATCTASSCDVTIYNSDWYMVSKTVSKNENAATADVTMGEKLLGITVRERTAALVLTCDANGNLS